MAVSSVCPLLSFSSSLSHSPLSLSLPLMLSLSLSLALSRSPPTASLALLPQGCDLPEQSTVHVVLPPAGPARRSEMVLQQRLGRGVEHLTRLDLSASRLHTTHTS